MLVMLHVIIVVVEMRMSGDENDIDVNGDVEEDAIAG